MAYENDPDIGNPGNVIPEPTPEQAAKDTQRRLHRIDPTLYKDPDKAAVPDPADQEALDKIREKDDEARAKEEAARERGEKSWDDLEKKDDDKQDDGLPHAELTVPMETPRDNYSQVEQYTQALTPLVKTAGVPQDTVQSVIDHAVSLAVTDQSGVDISDREACMSVLSRQLGEDLRTTVSDAQKAVSALGPQFARWLDETQLGNSPAVLQALASYTRGEFSMSATAAQAELDKLTRDPKGPYRNANHPKHRAASARANLLYARIAKGEAKAAAQPKPTPMKSGTGERMAALDAEIKSLNHHPAYRDKGHREHASIRARAERAYAERYPGNEDSE